MSGRVFNPYYFHGQLTKQLVALAEICDSWDQLKILSQIADLFYKNVDPEYQDLYKQFEATAKHLRDQGATSFTPACAADHCPCTIPCRESEQPND